MVAVFPSFTKVTSRDKKFFDEFNARYAPYADWAFGTLLTWWDAFGDLEFSTLNNNIIIRSSYLSMGERPQLVLLGNTLIDETIDAIFRQQKAAGEPVGIYSVPQYCLDALQHPENYRIEDDLNAAEYISSVEHHITMEGSELYHLRHAVHRFERDTEGRLLQHKEIPLDNLHAKMMLINALHTWHSNIYHNDRDRLEGAIIDKALLIAEQIDLKSFCLFIDHQLYGFVLYKPLHDAYININHIKVSKENANIFRYMNHAIAKHLHEQGYRFINGEQDLGIEGLRRYKSSLRPVAKFHKYNIFPV